MGQLNQKIALITGATSGIGLAIAERYVAEGAYVYITGRRSLELEEVKSKLGNNVTAVLSDISSLDYLDKLMETIKREKGRLDVLIANAGGGEFGSMGSITEKHFDQTFDINVKGTLFTVQKALPLLLKGSSVILMSSNAANETIYDLNSSIWKTGRSLRNRKHKFKSEYNLHVASTTRVI